jgi:hypothetical protein
VASAEPNNLREWRAVKEPAPSGRLFTCGRPGRATFGTTRRLVPDHVIDEWVKGLPSQDDLYIVSLLGRKEDGFSEFEYYPFRSATELGRQPTFQQWLNNRYARDFQVDEFPTVDARKITADVLVSAARRIMELLERGCSVVIIDSAGSVRTAKVCYQVGYEAMR